MKQIKLTTCGCGGIPYVYNDNPFKDEFEVMCNKCGIITDKYDDEISAVRYWNEAMSNGHGREE